MKRKSTKQEQGVALVVTVIVVAMLAVVGVALMQSTSADRAASRSVANIFRARLAAEAGLQEFVSLLASVVETNDFAVLTVTNGTTNYTALTQFLPSGDLNAFPLASRSDGLRDPLKVSAPFSGSNVFAACRPSFSGVSNGTNLNKLLQTFGAALEYPDTNSSNLVLNAQFVDCFTNSAGQAEIQYAFVVSDDCAKLNISRYGIAYTNAIRTNQDPARFSSEVAVANSGSNTVTLEQFSAYSSLPTNSRFGAVFPSVFSSTNERSQKNRFYSFHHGQAFDFVPPGYLSDDRSIFTAYADGGKFKYDLNKLATNGTDAQSNAFQIADIIKNNLPNFYKRDPSFVNDSKKPSDPLLRYNRRIGAAIVDYVDADSVITAITDGELAGKEMVAYPFQMAERYDLTVKSNSPTSFDATLKQTLFVELWNPYTESVGGEFRYQLETLREIEPPGSATVPIPQLSGQTTVSNRPNELKSYQIASQEIKFKIVGAAPSKANPIVLPQTSSTNDSLPAHSRFRAFWNEQPYDLTGSYNTNLFDLRGSGLEKSSRNLTNTNGTVPAWAANVGQSVSTTPGGYRSIADPRQNYINNYVWSVAAYTNAAKELRWNGASVYGANSPNTQRFEETWADRDTMRDPLHKGDPAQSATKNPTEFTSLYDPGKDSNNAPAFVRNGPMETVAELGHIYDPVHLNDSGTNTAGGNPKSYYSAGGGRTLRIGQPEFDYLTFTQGGQRSMNLLDLFTVRSQNDKTNVATNSRPAGLNINTAPLDVLAAFFYNLSPASDQGFTTKNKISLAGASNIATNIIAGRPYYSASDMHRFMRSLVVATNFSPTFPTNGFATNSALNILDRGREEMFRRAYDSLDAKSGAFRFYGVGRALSPQGEVQSQVGLEALVELRSTTNSAGQPVLRPVVTQRKFL